MKQRSFLLVGFVFACALSWLSGCNEPAKVQDSNAVSDLGGLDPKITFATMGHDFGNVSPNKVNTGKIEFTNTGEGVLKIIKVAKCCGVVTRLENEKAEYAPGESGAIDVEWRSWPQPGPFVRELVVHTNDKSTPTAKLRIHANVVLNLAWEPKQLKLFLDEDNAGCPKITMRSLDNKPFSIVAFKATGDCMTADFDPSAQATEFVLQPKVDMGKLDKNLKGQVTVGLTHPDGTAAVFAFDVLPKYTVNPPLMIVFNAEPEKPLLRKVSILNNYDKDFEIESIASKDNVVGVELVEQTKITNGYQLQVVITPPPSNGKLRFMDELYLVLGGGEKLPIKCNGYYKKTSPVSMTQ